MQIQKCSRCGEYREVIIKPKMRIQYQASENMIYNLFLCADCERKLEEFMGGADESDK